MWVIKATLFVFYTNYNGLWKQIPTAYISILYQRPTPAFRWMATFTASLVAWVDPVTNRKVNAMETEVDGISRKSPSKERELHSSFLLLVWKWEGPEVAHRGWWSHRRAWAWVFDEVLEMSYLIRNDIWSHTQFLKKCKYSLKRWKHSCSKNEKNIGAYGRK